MKRYFSEYKEISGKNEKEPITDDGSKCDIEDKLDTKEVYDWYNETDYLFQEKSAIGTYGTFGIFQQAKSHHLGVKSPSENIVFKVLDEASDAFDNWIKKLSS